MTVRLAQHSDVERISTMVAAAFADDPAWSFMIGPGNDTARVEFARRLLVPRIGRSTAWVTDDCTAVAMWDRFETNGPLDENEKEWWAQFRADVGADIGDRLDAYDAAVHVVTPSAPYWYLGVLATDPAHRGRGLATAVIQPGLAAAAADGWDCYLETSTSGNKSFYAGRGFLVQAEVLVPGGPPTWWLKRRHA